MITIRNLAEQMDEVRRYMEAGNPIIVPTDTNYNLACIPASKEAIDRIYQIKGRSRDKPLSLFFSDPQDWVQYGQPENENLMRLLVKRFWPGPLNLVVPKLDNRYDYMLQGNGSIALGCIKNADWQAFMQYFSGPIALTSANRSGSQTGLVTEAIAREHMKNQVKYILQTHEPGGCRTSSTIAQVGATGVRILRQGDITFAMLAKVLENEGFSVALDKTVS